MSHRLQEGAFAATNMTEHGGKSSLSTQDLRRPDTKAKCLHCVRTACILRTQRLGYSPKNTCHLFTSTAKQQSPHQNNKTAFSLVIKCRYEQANQPYKVQLCKGMQDAHMFKFWLLVL